MKKQFLFLFVFLFTVAFVLNGCEKFKTASKEEKKEETVKSEATQEETDMSEAKEEETDKSMVEVGTLASGGALMAEEAEDGASENNEGVAHFKEGHWDVAEKHFREAIEANSELAEAHYNLALALDKQGNHGDATSHFKTALDLAPDDPNISDSQILKDHVGG